MIIETERLLIRPWRFGDAPRVLDIQSRMEVIKWLGETHPVPMQNLTQARERIARYNARSQQPPLGCWAIEVRETGVVAGSVLLLKLPKAEHGEVEIGWHLHPDSWGHGVATEAAAVVLAHALASGLPEVLALTHVGNLPSQGVMRRIGMEPLGVVDKWYDGPSLVFRADHRSAQRSVDSSGTPETPRGSVRGESGTLPDVPERDPGEAQAHDHDRIPHEEVRPLRRR